MYMHNEKRKEKINMKETFLEIMAIVLVGEITSAIFDLCLQLTIVMAKQTNLNILVDVYSN